VRPTDLLGTWTLSRVVDDRRSGERRDVVGTAELTEVAPGRVRWAETGTMTWPGHTVPVGRTLFVVLEDDGWFVRFEDGRAFHPWAVGRRVEHPCAPDHYSGLIEVGPEPVGSEPVGSWTVTWDAVGPEKDYRMVTVHCERA
jgi:hypothetical protein